MCYEGKEMLTFLLYTLTFLPEHQHLPLYLTHLLTYLYKQASSVSSIRVSVHVLARARANTNINNYLLYVHSAMRRVQVLMFVLARART